MQVGVILAYFGLYFLAFLYGITFGSLSTVLVYRIPLKEKFTLNRSYCRTCKSRIAWYDLVPLISYMLLKGRCRKCQTKIPALYPSIEALNGIGYVLVFMINGFSLLSILYCLFFTVLIVVSVIDWRTHRIPPSLDVCILVLGVLRIILDFSNLLEYLIGFCAVSVFLTIICCAAKGRVVDQGTVGLMAASGLFLGWKKILLALVLGSIMGLIIHIVLMKTCIKDRVLAFGPYLSAGIVIAMLFGDQMTAWYLGLFK